MITKFCVAYNQYGGWSVTTPFDTRELAQRHIDRILTSNVHSGDKSHCKNKQIIEIQLDETVDQNPAGWTDR